MILFAVAGAGLIRLCQFPQSDASCADPCAFWPWPGVSDSFLSAFCCAQAFLYPRLHDGSASHPRTRTASRCEFYKVVCKCCV